MNRSEIPRKNSRDSRVRDRIRCVLLDADGWTVIDETSVRRHFSDWLNDEKLKPANGGYDSHLSERQTTELIAYLTDKSALSLYQIKNC